ncbi:MAG: hypothetical protein KKB79_01845 [Nanoarchaeota archaeon]|nr:hypothetical protein [Nanoarchaeota archaeon]
MSRQVVSKAGKMILLEFARGILESTDSYRTVLIREGVREILFYHKRLEMLEKESKIKQSKDIRKVVREKIKEDSKVVDVLGVPKSRGEVKFDVDDREGSARAYLSSFSIPEFALPDTVRDIKPVPRSERINLGRLNQLLNDPFVKTIECSGSDEKVFVTGVMGRKKTSIILSGKEIEDVIMAFSKLGKIPMTPGIFKVFFGNLSMSAMVSEVIGSRFLIKKVPMGYGRFG